MRAYSLLLAVLFLVSCHPSSKASSSSPFERLERTLQRYKGHFQDPTVRLHLISALGDVGIARRWQKDYLQKVSLQGKTLWYFPKRRGNLPIEPHTNQYLKVCQDRRLSPKRYALILQSAYLRFRWKPERWRQDLAWTLLVFARGGKRSWKNLWGERIDLTEVGDTASQWLDELLQPIAEAKRENKFFAKGELHRWPCMGFHLFHGLWAFQSQHWLPEKWQKRLPYWIDLHFYRLRKEPGLYWALVQRKRGKHPKLSLYLALWKFYSHFFEVFGWAKTQGLWQPTPEQQKQLQHHARVFTQILGWFQKEQLFERSWELRRQWGERFFRDLWGDACHALLAWYYWKDELKFRTNKEK